MSWWNVFQWNVANKNTKIHMENQGNETVQLNLFLYVTLVCSLLVEHKTSIFSTLDSH